MQMDHAADVGRQASRRAVNPRAGAVQRDRDGGKHATVIALQRKAGNRAVTRLLAGPPPIEQRRRSGSVAIQLEAAAKQKQRELVSKATEAAVKMFDAQWGKTSEFAPVFSASVKALVDSAATGGDELAILGAAASKAGLKILPVLYPRVKKPVLDWFNSRSTAEQILVTLPFAAGIGFGSVFGSAAVGKAVRDDTEGGRKIRDTGFEALNGTDLPTGLPWLKATLTVKAHQGEPTDKKYQPAMITGAMITVDVGELTGFRF